MTMAPYPHIGSELRGGVVLDCPFGAPSEFIIGFTSFTFKNTKQKYMYDTNQNFIFNLV